MYITLLTHNPDVLQPCMTKKPFENIVGKGENAFLFFPQCFLPFPLQISNFQYIYFVVCKFIKFGPFQNFVVW